ncbi:secondary thiamine-phosphate synthase enzyme YjbQ [Synechococcus sp. ATX 2A4]|uniref:secondary thiamine-phosphate synthase enzyme YjbQ n=1 Tax=Synechococcus sp. ATX 2A4 TaxID=2823727 RepID=UPI0020CF95E9|nr:secondary thiamine-phosphate synthase enzyme YjbQ [Synechococcus sp. ATX 2A4]
MTTSGLRQGVLNMLVRHTSCSLIINENADPRVLRDLSAFLQALVPHEGLGPLSGAGKLRAWLHDDEGPDDMPAHVRTALTASTLSLPFDQGRLMLGTWQAVYLWEHRAAGSCRELSLHLLGE